MNDEDCNLILRIFEEQSAEDAHWKLRNNLLSPQNLRYLEDVSIYNLSNYFGAPPQEDLRKILDDPRAHSIWGGKYALELKSLVRMQIDAILEEAKSVIHSKICDDFDYCGKRDRGELESEKSNLILAVAETLLTIFVGIPLIATITVYLIKNHVLDDWCGCENTG